MPETFQEFTDPRLVLLYDSWSSSRDDFDFYLALAQELVARDIVDIGCGTGVLACELAERGFAVTGVDPASRMLAVARQRPGGHLVRWVEGNAGALEAASAGLAVMSAHVPQVIHDQDAWRDTLRATHRALRAGGRVAFESRNPQARAWKDWTPERSHGRLASTPLGEVDLWIDVLDVSGDLVTYDIHYRLVASGEELVSHDVLRFRSREELEAGLRDSGFVVERVYGDWDRSEVGERSPELIFVAYRD